MKSRRVMLICVTLAVVTVTALVTYSYLHKKYGFSEGADTTPRREFVLSERETEMFFRFTPEEFMKCSLVIYDHVEDFRKNASLRSDGKLVLRLSDEQIRCLYEMHYSGLENYANISHVDVSKDNRELLISGSVSEIEYAMLNKLDPYTLRDMALHQLLDGVEPSEIGVMVRIVDTDAEKTVFEAYWPDEEMVWNASDLFTEQKKD